VGEVMIREAGSGRIVRTLRGHTDPVTSVAYSPDGRRLATASGEHGLPQGVVPCDIKLWDVALGQELHTLVGHTSAVWCVVFSPDGRWLASAGHDKTVRVWDAVTGKQIHTLAGHADQVNSVAFGPDSRHLLSGSSDGTVKLWDAVRGLEITTLRGSAGPVRAVAFDPKGALIAAAGSTSAGTKASIDVWDPTTGRLSFCLVGHSLSVSALAFSPDGQRLASGGADRTVMIWDMGTGQVLLTLAGHRGAVRSVAFSSDGRHLVSAGNDRTVKIWSTMAPGSDLAVEREARSLVQFAFGKPLLRPAARERIRTDTTVAEPVRELALALAEHYPEDPQCLYEACRAVIRRPDAGPERYRLALSQAEDAYRRDDTNGAYCIAVGAACYRLGLYQEAVAFLRVGASYIHPQYGGPHPVELAITTMAEHRLGHAKPAQEALGQLRALMKGPTWSNDDEARPFAEEAEALLRTP
jgi:hypothetical protein